MLRQQLQNLQENHRYVSSPFNCTRNIKNIYVRRRKEKYYFEIEDGTMMHTYIWCEGMKRNGTERVSLNKMLTQRKIVIFEFILKI